MTETDPSSLHFVDTHAHLSDERFSDDAPAVVQRAARLGVGRVVNVAFSRSMWVDAVTLSGANPGVFHSAGVHPNSADEWSDETRQALEQFLVDHSPVAIGETGLDYYWDTHPRDVQIAAFRDQLAIAREAGLPVIIHMRGDVETDIRAILDDATEPMCIFHSFDGSALLAEWIIDKGWMIGAGGLMSRRSARELRAILQSVPADLLLLETDSPYLAPTGWEEKRNSPESIPIIAGHVARLREESVEDIANTTTRNAERVFGLPPLPSSVESRGTEA